MTPAQESSFLSCLPSWFLLVLPPQPFSPLRPLRPLRAAKISRLLEASRSASAGHRAQGTLRQRPFLLQMTGLRCCARAGCWAVPGSTGLVLEYLKTA